MELSCCRQAPGGHRPRQVCSRRGPAPGPSIRPLIQHPLASRRPDGWARAPPTALNHSAARQALNLTHGVLKGENVCFHNLPQLHNI